jgi:multimeric flavodoxin WrbA
MKGKKVLVLLRSPRRKGNSAILAEQIAKGAKSGKAKYVIEVADCRKT